MNILKLTWFSLIQLMGWDITKAVTVFNNVVNGIHCNARYADSFFVSSLDSSLSIVSSCSSTSSFLECCTTCDPIMNCAGVVYHEENCCKLTNGSTLRNAAVQDHPDLPRVMLYDDSAIPSVSWLHMLFSMLFSLMRRKGDVIRS